MVALRNRPLAAFTGSFWFSALCAVLAPTSIGYQDLAAYLARQPGVSERWRDHLIASPFGTIHAATFSFSRPIGTTLSEPVGAQTVNLDPRSLDRAHALHQIEGNPPRRTLEAGSCSGVGQPVVEVACGGQQGHGPTGSPTHQPHTHLRYR